MLLLERILAVSTHAFGYHHISQRRPREAQMLQRPSHGIIIIHAGGDVKGEMRAEIKKERRQNAAALLLKKP
nr:MAG TPA: hypothetical protein [Caudoviricetes sp.]